MYVCIHVDVTKPSLYVSFLWACGFSSCLLHSTFWSLATVSTPQICSSKILWLPLATSMAKTSAIASTHGSSRPGLWATPLRLNHRLKVMKSEATVGWRRWWCNLRSTPSFIMMRLSVIQKSCVLVAGFSYNSTRKRVTSLYKNWKLLKLKIIENYW